MPSPHGAKSTAPSGSAIADAPPLSGPLQPLIEVFARPSRLEEAHQLVHIKYAALRRSPRHRRPRRARRPVQTRGEGSVAH